MSPRAERAFAATILGAMAIALSGCAYLRLLQFKNQLKSFEENVIVIPGEELVFRFRNPIVRSSDFVFITGSQPSRIDRLDQAGNAEIWTWRFQKKRESVAHKPFEMAFMAQFQSGGLNRLQVDPIFVELVGREFTIQLLRQMGFAKVNNFKRKVTIAIASDTMSGMPMPSLEDIGRTMGEPSVYRLSGDSGSSYWEYEFHFYNPESGKSAGKFNLRFHGDLQNPSRPITGLVATGKT